MKIIHHDKKKLIFQMNKILFLIYGGINNLIIKIAKNN